MNKHIWLLVVAIGCNNACGIGGSQIILHNAAPMPVAVALVQLDTKANLLSSYVEYPNKSAKGWVSIGMIPSNSSVAMMRPYYKKGLDTLLIYSYSYDQLVSAVHDKKRPEQFFKIGQVGNKELFIVEDQKTRNLTVQKSVKGVDLSWVKKDNLPLPVESQLFQVGGDRESSVLPGKPSRAGGQEIPAEGLLSADDWSDLVRVINKVHKNKDAAAIVEEINNELRSKPYAEKVNVFVSQEGKVMLSPVPTKEKQLAAYYALSNINKQVSKAKKPQPKKAQVKTSAKKSVAKPASPEKPSESAPVQEQAEFVQQGDDPYALSQNIDWNVVHTALSRAQAVAQPGKADIVAAQIIAQLGDSSTFLTVMVQEGEVVLNPAPQDGRIVNALQGINQKLKQRK